MNTRSGDFRQLNDLEGRARSILEAEARKAEKEKANPPALFKQFIVNGILSAMGNVPFCTN